MNCTLHTIQHFRKLGVNLNDLVVKVLDSQSRGLEFKTIGLGGPKVDAAFHPSEVDKMSARNFWELGVIK